MEPDELSVLDIIQEIMESDRSFHGIVRYLDVSTRNNLVAAQLRNTNNAMALVRQFMTDPAPTTVVMNMPLNGAFLDPVPVVPSPQQVNASLEMPVHVPETTCSICQETIDSAVRIRQCGHCFHNTCIRQWFSMNPRCPMCRIDIRETTFDNATSSSDNESSSVHSDTE